MFDKRRTLYITRIVIYLKRWESNHQHHYRINFVNKLIVIFLHEVINRLTPFPFLIHPVYSCYNLIYGNKIHYQIKIM